MAESTDSFLLDDNLCDTCTVWGPTIFENLLVIKLKTINRDSLGVLSKVIGISEAILIMGIHTLHRGNISKAALLIVKFR